MLVILSLYVILSILDFAAGHLFCACLVSVQVFPPLCNCRQHTGVVRLSLQADGKVAFEDISICLACAAQPVISLRCRPYLFVLDISVEAVLLPYAWGNKSGLKATQ